MYNVSGPDSTVFSCILIVWLPFHAISTLHLFAKDIQRKSFRGLEQPRYSLTEAATDRVAQEPGCSDGWRGKRSTPRIHCWTTQLPMSKQRFDFKLYISNYFLLYYVSGPDSTVFPLILIVWLPFHAISTLHIFAIDIQRKSLRDLEQPQSSLTEAATDRAAQGPGCSDGWRCKPSTPRIHCWSAASKKQLDFKLFIRLLSIVLCQWTSFYSFLLYPNCVIAFLANIYPTCICTTDGLSSFR